MRSSMPRRSRPRLGLPQPCAAELPYSVVHRSWVETPEMRRGARCVRRAGGRIVRARGRRAHRQVRPRPERRPRGRRPPGSATRWRSRRQLGDLARELDTTSAALAIAFALANPAVAKRPVRVDDRRAGEAERGGARARRATRRRTAGRAPGDRLRGYRGPVALGVRGVPVPRAAHDVVEPVLRLPIRATRGRAGCRRTRWSGHRAGAARGEPAKSTPLARFVAATTSNTDDPSPVPTLITVESPPASR